MRKQLNRNSGYIKLKSTGRVLGMFYRRVDEKTQYITFYSTVVSIESSLIEPATPKEVEDSRKKRMDRQERMLSSSNNSDTATQEQLDFSSDKLSQEKPHNGDNN